MVATTMRTAGTTVDLGPAAIAGATGAGLLLARPLLVADVDRPTPVLVAVFVAVGVIGAWWPLRRLAAAARSGDAGSASGSPAAVAPTARTSGRPAGLRVTAWVTLAGMAAFAVGRALSGGAPAAPALLGYVVLNSLAAVAEEALFRRLVYATLAPFGAAVAVVGSALAFAAVHVTVWGAWVLPLDLAAGLVLSWQRWASGRWSVPAATHVFANLVAVLP